MVTVSSTSRSTRQLHNFADESGSMPNVLSTQTSIGISGLFAIRRNFKIIVTKLDMAGLYKYYTGTIRVDSIVRTYFAFCSQTCTVDSFDYSISFMRHSCRRAVTVTAHGVLALDANRQTGEREMKHSLHTLSSTLPHSHKSLLRENLSNSYDVCYSIHNSAAAAPARRRSLRSATFYSW